MSRGPTFDLVPVDAPPVRPTGPKPWTLGPRSAADVQRVLAVPKDEARWPVSFLRHVDVVAAAIRGMPTGLGPDEQAVAIIYAVAAWHGRGRHYWPSAEALRTAARDWRIYNREFDGRNARELAQKYRMTLRGIQFVLQRQRAHQNAARKRRREAGER